jgi:hypothetical protein
MLDFRSIPSHLSFNTVLGVSENLDQIPEHEREYTENRNKCSGATERDGVLPAECSSFQRCSSIYTCPQNPIYRETKGLLHSENTLELEEYS